MRSLDLTTDSKEDKNRESENHFKRAHPIMSRFIRRSVGELSPLSLSWLVFRFVLMTIFVFTVASVTALAMALKYTVMVKWPNQFASETCAELGWVLLPGSEEDLGAGNIVSYYVNGQ